MNERKLYLETQAAARIKERIVTEYGDDADLIRDTLEGATNLRELLAAASLELAITEGRKEGIEIAIVKMKERLTRECNHAQAIRNGISAAMEVAELNSIKTPAATLSMRASPPRVEITDAAAIPALYMVQPPPSPDKRAIAAALKDGAIIPGAALSNQPPALSVRFN